jgi:branched-chain amino acid transport system permease protein
MDQSLFFWWVVAWMLVWGAAGSIVTPMVYVRRNLEISRSRLAGATLGAAIGPFGLAALWSLTPKLSTRWLVFSSLLALSVFSLGFAVGHPENSCVTNSDYVISLLANGVVMGTIYGLMALGLALIFSILGIVSFAHGEFYMIGGMVVYWVTAVWLPDLHPVFAVVIACGVTFALGATFERLFLTPIYTGQVERPVEYAILITFGLAFFLQYFVMAIAGANPVKAQRFFDFPIVRLPSEEDPWLLRTTRGGMTLFDIIIIPNPRFFAMLISIIMLVLMVLFLFRTWPGMALRAVAQDRQAAAVAGINPDRMNMLAFGIGCMLAGLSGAVLVQAFSWLPQVGMMPALRSFVIIVLGGLGSLPGAFLGGIILGLVESVGTGCIPDPTRAAAYLPAYGMIILTLVLLLRPTGLFGRQP